MVKYFMFCFKKQVHIFFYLAYYHSGSKMRLGGIIGVDGEIWQDGEGWGMS